ncbi:MAG: LemA family protein [Deltaproteobacteria bacterium RBG_13_61_14]|nr:MAG: LemA family protein [Deltaproteobacteria bacterium RBG_13_61_14]
MRSRKRWIGLALAVLVLGCGCGYNRIVADQEAIDQAWSEVDNQLKRRNDLIPNYVETVKGYASHEKEVFVKVTEARAKLAGATQVPDKMKAANELSGALSRLLVVVEQYPQLKADQNFIRLQDELAGTENRIAVARRRYNEAVQAYNTRIRKFPGLVWARIFGFEKRPYFEVPEESKQVPQVKFE